MSTTEVFDSTLGLGDLPLTVLSAVMLNEYPEDEDIWAGLQAALAEMSTDSRHQTIEGVNHITLILEEDVLAEAVEDLIERIGS